MKSHPLNNWRQILAVLCISALLAACGGGISDNADNDSPQSTGPVLATQLASGTITGFGSVYVDGVRIDDSDVKTVSEQADGSETASLLKLGQRVSVAHDGKGRAARVELSAAVIGQVAAIDTATSQLTVAGQVVRVNTDSTLGPITQFGSLDGSYLALANVALTDTVEVYGTPLFDSASNNYQIVATRIDKLEASTRVQISGKIANLTETSFNIGNLTVTRESATTVVPTNATLANEQTVKVWSTAAGISNNSISAQRIRVLQGHRATNATQRLDQVQLGGVISNYDASSNTFELSGTRIDASSATLRPSTAVLANAAYVQVSGTLDEQGVLSAQNIAVRGANTASDLAKIQLSGVISSLDDQTHFVVRGVPVDASAATIVKTNCSADLTTSTYVEVVAQVQAGSDVVLASRLTCKSAQQIPPRAIRFRSGQVSQVDSSAQTFTLTRLSQSQSVRWDDATGFVGLQAADLATLGTTSVAVSGYVEGNVLVARLVAASRITPGYHYEHEDQDNDGRDDDDGQYGGGYDDDDDDDGANSTRPSKPKWRQYREARNQR